MFYLITYLGCLRLKPNPSPRNCFPLAQWETRWILTLICLVSREERGSCPQSLVPCKINVYLNPISFPQCIALHCFDNTSAKVFPYQEQPVAAMATTRPARRSSVQLNLRFDFHQLYFMFIDIGCYDEICKESTIYTILYYNTICTTFQFFYKVQNCVNCNSKYTKIVSDTQTKRRLKDFLFLLNSL